MYVRTIGTDPEVTVFSSDVLVRQTDLNVDVQVRLADGSRWAATIFTVTNLRTQLAKSGRGTSAAGARYLWFTDLLVVDTISDQSLLELVDDLIASDRLTTVFVRLDDLAPR